VTDNGGSSAVFDTKRYGNVKSKPEYRRIRMYYKSAGKWRDDRLRRKRVLKLHEEGLSYAGIADRLGVSERTVKRDMAKIKPYYDRKIRSYLHKLAEERQANIEAELEGKSLGEQLKILEKTWVNYSKLVKQREYLRRQLTVTIDLDAAAAGYPAFKVAPTPPVSINYPFNIKFELTTKGKKIIVGALTIRSESKRATDPFGC
jgi:DNA-binding CsgD family transcriptional regulator